MLIADVCQMQTSIIVIITSRGIKDFATLRGQTLPDQQPLQAVTHPPWSCACTAPVPTFLWCPGWAPLGDRSSCTAQGREGGQGQTLTPHSKCLEAQHHTSARAGGSLWVTAHSRCMSPQKPCKDSDRTPELQTGREIPAEPSKQHCC